jgi:hypothetical protein
MWRAGGQLLIDGLDSLKADEGGADRLAEVIYVSGPQRSKIILVFGNGATQTAGPHTKMTFGYIGDGTARFSSYLKQKGFAFTDASHGAMERRQ